MMTQEYIREMLEESVRDPLALCKVLNVVMSQRQRELLVALATAQGKYQVEADDKGDVMRASLVALFWRTLKTPMSIGIILGSTRERRRESMAFLHQLTQQHNALSAVCHFKEPHWWRLIFGFRPNWQIVTPTARPEQLAGLHSENMTVLVLDGQPEMLPAVEMATALCSHETDLVIQLW